MSRSKKKTQIRAITTACSEKENKREANKKLRRLIKGKLQKFVIQKREEEIEILPILREVSNVWCFDKDGKIYVQNMTDKEMRK